MINYRVRRIGRVNAFRALLLIVVFAMMNQTDEEVATHMYCLSKSIITTSHLCRQTTLKVQKAVVSHLISSENKQLSQTILQIGALTLTTAYAFVLIFQLRYSLTDNHHDMCTSISRHNIHRMLLLLAGDIHPNPGPSSFSDSSSDITSSYIHVINSGLSVMHINIQSINTKLDILEIEMQPYDVIVLTETWLSQHTNTDNILIPNFNPPFRCDRIGRVGGGVAIYVRDSLYAKERTDLSINQLEAVWIELHTNQRKLLIGGIYRPPDSNNNHWNLLQESIDRAFNQICDNILITGDFNINVQNSTANKISRLISSYNAEQLISTPTHYTEHSCSLIDLMIVKHTNHVITKLRGRPLCPRSCPFPLSHRYCSEI